ncbi:MAG: hypothetical protein ACT4P6_20275 [Gemmatimonadaceae bacterium]
MAVEVKSPVSAPAIPVKGGRRAITRSPIGSEQLPEFAADSLTVPRRTLWLGVGLALLIAAIHIAASWGLMPVYWGDSGRWLHEVDRFAQGERAYRDFFWAFPPLAMWLIGGAARIVGSDLAQILTITALISAAVAAAWSVFAVRLVGERFALLAVAVILPLGIAYSTTQSAPMATGMYTPAAPVGFLCLLLQLVAAVSLARSNTSRAAIALGVFGALCLLAKHDFWLPAAVLMVGAPWLTSGPARWRTYVGSWMAAAVVLGAAAAFLAAQNGFGVFLGILTGFGHLQELSGRGIPALETLTVEAMAAALCTAVVAGAVALTRPDKRRRATLVASFAGGLAVILGAIWLGSAVWIARFGTAGTGDRLTDLATQYSREQWSMIVLLKNAVTVLRQRLTLHALPTLVPFAVLALFVRYRNRATPFDRSLAFLLLLTVGALRARRGMEYAEWTSMLVEIPVYAYVARILLADRIEEWYGAAKVILASLACLFLWQHMDNGYGPFTRRGSRVAVETPRGSVRLVANQANHYRVLKRAVDAMDPTGRRPVMSFGYSGSLNYFLDRPAPSPLTHGFRLSSIDDPNEAVRLVRAASPAVIAIDNPFFDFQMPTTAFHSLHWQARTRVSHYIRYDRRYFEQVVAGCTAEASGLRGFTLYDCPERDGQVVNR